jgi:protocatechuate 4,5-dioxygenase, beta chain
MAQLVSIIGVSHSPYLPNVFRKYPDIPENDRKSFENYQHMRERLAAVRPDVVLTIGSDHFNNFFLENMPAFIVGKCRQSEGPHPRERGGEFGLPHYQAKVDVDTAKAVIRHGFTHGVDFAFSDNLYIEHSISLPMAYIRPEMDLPIVPMFTNVLAPPVPPAERFLQVGKALNAIVSDLPASSRVAIVSSGHLAIDVGGPHHGKGSMDPDWDRKVVEIIREGDVDHLLEEASWEKLSGLGTVTPGFLNFVLLVGAANGAKTSYADVNISDWHGSTPFLVWD